MYIPGGSQPPALAKALTERGMDPSKIKIMGQGKHSPTKARLRPWAIARSGSLQRFITTKRTIPK